MAPSLSSSPLVTFTDPEMALITLLLRSGEGKVWGCEICGQRFSCSASLNTHILTVEACGGVLAELNGKGVFGLASTYACLAAADWEGNKEMIECYVGLWEVSIPLFMIWPPFSVWAFAAVRDLHGWELSCG